MLPANECLGERMKETVIGIIQTSIRCVENDISKHKKYLKQLQSGEIKEEKAQIEFEIDTMKGLINTNTSVFRHYKGVLKGFKEIPVCNIAKKMGL